MLLVAEAVPSRKFRGGDFSNISVKSPLAAKCLSELYKIMVKHSLQSRPPLDPPLPCCGTNK